MPAVGSSSSRISGSVRSARHTINLRFMPPESLRTVRLRNLIRSQNSSSSSVRSLDFLARHEIQSSLVFHDLVHCHILTHGIFLRDDTDLAFQIRTVAGQFLPVNQNFALCREQKGRKKADGSCFSGPVRSKKTEKFSGLNFEIQRIDGCEIVKGFGQVLWFRSFVLLRNDQRIIAGIIRDFIDPVVNMFVRHSAVFHHQDIACRFCERISFT